MVEGVKIEDGGGFKDTIAGDLGISPLNALAGHGGPLGKDNNYTRFICISQKPEIYPGADRTSLMMTLPHKPGALYHVLSKFYALGINLQKLESRPLPDREFEFMFYFDLECSVYAPEMERLFRDLEEESEQCRYLGTYQEVIC